MPARLHENWLAGWIPSGGDVAIDCGANEGLWTRFLAPRFGRVLAIEPNETIWPHLEKNLPENVTVCRWAAMSSIGQREFSKPPYTVHFHLSELYPENNTPKAQIPCHTLDFLLERQDLLPPGKRVAFLKMDIEGSELEAIRGAERLLNEHQPEFIIEAHGHERLVELVKMLGGRYCLRTIAGPEFRPDELTWQEVCWLYGTPLLHVRKA